MSAERDSNGLAAPNTDRDPEVIDVVGHAIDFRGECNGSAGDVDEVAVIQARVNRPDVALVAMRQRLREIWRRPALRPFAIHCGQAPRIALPSHKTTQAEQRHCQCGDVISGKHAE